MGKKPRENRIPIMMSDEELTAIDDWRFNNRVATRSDAIRRLCEIGLEAHQSSRAATDEAIKFMERLNAAETATHRLLPFNLGKFLARNFKNITDIFMIIAELRDITVALTTRSNVGDVSGSKKYREILSERLSRILEDEEK